MAPLPPKITTIESLTERTSLTWTHNTVCFNTSDIEYVVSWVDLASGGGLNGTTVKRNFTIRTGVRGVYRVRIMATVRGMSSVGGKDSGTEVLVHPGMLPLCVVCACPKIHTLRMSQYCTGQPTAQGTEGGACFGQPFYLTCLHSYTTNHDIIWSVNGTNNIIGTSNLVYFVGGVSLLVPNVTEDLFSNVVTTFKCAVILNGTKFTGEPYLMDPIGTVTLVLCVMWSVFHEMCSLFRASPLTRGDGHRLHPLHYSADTGPLGGVF